MRDASPASDMSSVLSQLARGAAILGVIGALSTQPIANVLAQQPATRPALRIVVIEGEDAVNIIQQKTAVAPVVEVRDENDLPVSGVILRFTVSDGATFGGQSTISVTTNAAGRATATGFTPTSSGAVKINVVATHQGQTAAATITQTNYATAAEAAQAGQSASTSSGSSGTSGTSGATGAGGAGGGGLSTTTLAVIGGAAAGGGLLAAKAAGGSDNGGGGNSGGAGGTGGAAGQAPGGGGGPSGTQNLVVNGTSPISVTYSWTYVEGGFSCGFTQTRTAAVRLNLQVQSSGTVAGTGDVTYSGASSSAITCSLGFTFPGGSSDEPPTTISGPVTGSTGNLVFNQTQTTQETLPGTGDFSGTWTIRFTGALSGGVVTGTLTETSVWSAPGFLTSGGGTGSAQLTLR